jgi:hypothetical protein
MFDLKAHLFARSAIGFELVGDHDARRSCRLLEKLAHEPLRGSSISPALDENVENEAILIDSAPKPVLPASDRDHNLIHVPLVAASRCAPANAIGILPAEFLGPMTNTFVANVNAAGGEHFLDHPQAERKSKIEPNCVRNHIGWEAMSAVEGITRMFHDPPLSTNRPRLVKLAVPAELVAYCTKQKVVQWRLWGALCHSCARATREPSYENIAMLRAAIDAQHRTGVRVMDSCFISHLAEALLMAGM